MAPTTPCGQTTPQPDVDYLEVLFTTGDQLQLVLCIRGSLRRWVHADAAVCRE